MFLYNKTFRRKVIAVISFLLICLIMFTDQRLFALSGDGIEFSGLTAQMKADKQIETVLAAETIAQMTVPMYAVTHVYMREQPENNANSICVLSKGESVYGYVSSLSDDWIKVRHGDDEGYVYSKYLTITQVQPDTPQQTTAVKQITIPANGFALYSVNGSVLDPEIQKFMYNLCVSWGIAEYYPYLQAQFYQESRFNQTCVSPHGDYGICQLKGIYHEYFKMMVGHPEWDLVNDPYANVYVGVFLMQQNIHKNNGNLQFALSDYYQGSGYAAKYGMYAPYVEQVSQWFDKTTKIS